jgi:hypothetical protein
MKCLLVTGILLFGQLASAQRSIGDIKVTVESDGESLESCFKAIERQTGLLFAFLPGQVDPYTTINVPLGTRTISATLDLLLTGTNLTYRQMNNSIVIFLKTALDQFLDSTLPPFKYFLRLDTLYCSIIIGLGFAGPDNTATCAGLF